MAAKKDSASLAKKTPKKNLASYKALHDPNVKIPNKIRAAFAAMLKKDGPEAWEYEGDFRKIADISQTQLSEFREQFLDHIVVAPAAHGTSRKNCWIASAKAAAKFRNSDP